MQQLNLTPETVGGVSVVEVNLVARTETSAAQCVAAARFIKVHIAG